MRIGQKRCCARGDRTDKFFNMGRRNLAQEISVVRLVRSLRVFESYIAGEVPIKKHKSIKDKVWRVPLSRIDAEESPPE